MKNFIKHLSIWVFVFLAGMVSVYVTAQVSSVSIEANIGSFVQYIGSLFVTSDGTPSGNTLFSVDGDGVSFFGLERENAGPGLLGVNSDGRMVNTRPLSYVTLPNTSDTQQLQNNHAYIVPYWEERGTTFVLLPDTCVVGDEIQIQALSLPLDISATSPMQIIAPYLEGEWAGYGYGNPTFVPYDNYLIFGSVGYSITEGYCDSGVGPGYPYDWCYDEWNDDLQQTELFYGNGASPSGYESKFPPRFVSFLCIDSDKYLMQIVPLGINGYTEFFYEVNPDSGYGDEYGIGSPDYFGQ